MEDKRICIGKIINAHGIKGAIKIQTYTEDPMALADYHPITDKTGKKQFAPSIHSCHKGVVIATLEGITDRNAALSLKNTELFIKRSQLPQLEDEEEFYYSDLIGLQAQLEDGTIYGDVVAVHEYGAGDILEIKRAGTGKNEMLSFTYENVPEIKIKEKILIVNPPEVEFASKEHDN